MLSTEFLQTISSILEEIKNGEYNNTILTDLFDLVTIRTEQDEKNEESRTFFIFKLKPGKTFTEREVLQIMVSWEYAWDINHVDNRAIFTPDYHRGNLCILNIALVITTPLPLSISIISKPFIYL